MKVENKIERPTEFRFIEEGTVFLIPKSDNVFMKIYTDEYQENNVVILTNANTVEFDGDEEVIPYPAARLVLV